jgi:hypothetical protein
LKDGWIVDGEDEIASMWRSDKNASNKKKSVGFHSNVKSDMSNRKSIEHSFSPRHNHSMHSDENHSNTQPRKGMGALASSLKSMVSNKSAETSPKRKKHGGSSQGDSRHSHSHPRGGKKISPRRGAFEAKFDKFLANKSQKILKEARKEAKKQ